MLGIGKWGRKCIHRVDMRVQWENTVSLNDQQSAHMSGYPSASVP